MKIQMNTVGSSGDMQLDQVLSADAWSLDDDASLRMEFIRRSLVHHIEKCLPYREFAERCGFRPRDLREPEDIINVPQFPAMAFKTVRTLMSCSPEAVAKRCTSSGTMGRISEVMRDQLTIDRMLSSIRWGTELLGHWNDDDVAVLNLGPNQEEAGDLWFAYVSTLLEAFYSTSHMVRNGRFNVHQVGDVLNDLEERYPVVLLLGPPPLVLSVLRSLDGKRSEPRDSTFVITAGGWKRSTGEMMDRSDFDSLACSALNLAHNRQVRDVFNQVELNTVLVECAHHYKHVPPWLEVIVRDPYTLDPITGDKEGLLSYLDPTAYSYPCFFIGEDFGRLDTAECDCGRVGRRLFVTRRVKRDEDWGCARKMDRDYGG